MKEKEIKNLNKLLYRFTELAEELYDLYIKRGVLIENQGCGKQEWVRRILNGCGSSRPYSKTLLYRCIEMCMRA